ncbi:MAG TPA: 50S ribosomal protein L19e [Candidatus Nanoarchaeia archaeon]|nr:50S ribosomal protein L19e [Candidatus Nanoarchaeia archaeon]
MNLDKKRQLASRTLLVGKGKIIFNNSRLAEIQQAITKQDIRDLFKSGAISIQPIHGRKAVKNEKKRKGKGKIRKIVRNKKQEYVQITRKLRKYIQDQRVKGKMTNELYYQLRKEIKAHSFKTLNECKERLKTL